MYIWNTVYDVAFILQAYTQGLSVRPEDYKLHAPSYLAQLPGHSYDWRIRWEAHVARVGKKLKQEFIAETWRKEPTRKTYM